MTTAVYEEQKKKRWAKSQILSTHHALAILFFGFVVFGGCLNFAVLTFGFLMFFLVTSIKMVYKMILFCILISAIVVLVPVLAPLAVVLMIVLFILRLKYIAKNWRPIVAGLFFYFGSGALVLTIYAQTVGKGRDPNVAVALVTALVLATTLHFLLLWLYRHEYSAETALGIMGSVPLLIIALLLPFLKLVSHAGDGMGDGHFFGGHHSYDSFDPQLHHGADVHHGYVVEPQGAHFVHGHLRTSPDNIVENNLSYHGSGAYHDPNIPTQQIKGYFRTNPDSVVENNFSYHGPYTQGTDQDNL